MPNTPPLITSDDLKKWRADLGQQMKADKAPLTQAEFCDLPEIQAEHLPVGTLRNYERDRDINSQAAQRRLRTIRNIVATMLIERQGS